MSRKKGRLSGPWWTEQGVVFWAGGDRLYAGRMTRWSSVPRRVWWQSRWLLIPMCPHRALERHAMAVVLDRPPDDEGGLSPLRLTVDHWSDEFPYLWANITQTTWPGGAARETCSLFVFVDDFTLKGMLKDPNKGKCLWVSAESMGALFACLEEALETGKGNWKVDRQAKPKGKSGPR